MTICSAFVLKKRISEDVQYLHTAHTARQTNERFEVIKRISFFTPHYYQEVC